MTTHTNGGEPVSTDNDITVPGKRCSGCKETKSLDDFFRRSAAKDGRQNYCRACGYAAHDAWVSRNPDVPRERLAAWNAANPGVSEASSAAWKKANPERRRAIVRAWNAAHPETVKDNARIRRARKAAAPVVEHIRRSIVWQRDGGICHICGTAADPADWHLEHIVPLARGGEHSYRNVAVSHPDCNRRKGAKLIDPLAMVPIAARERMAAGAA